MEITALRLIRNILGGGLCLVAVPQVLALPIVESRTGDPVVRAPQDLSSSASTASNRSYDSTYSGLQQIESLKEELNLLRGSMEEKQHALEIQLQGLKKSQQDFYVDLDKRLSQLERSKTSGGSKTTSQAVPIPAVVPVAPATAAVLPHSHEGVDGEEQELAEADDTTTLEKPLSKALTEKACYEEASASLSAHRYAEAIKGFGDCVARYPQGAYTAQCYYWLGESYMAQWGSHKDDKTLLDKASQAFLMVTTRFPTHQRATDALLKLGMVEQEKGNIDVSKRYFEQVRDRYPDSAAARMAEAYLQED